jgi:DNA-binding CsgD family transcriptional regulator
VSHDALTPREKEIAALVARGLRDREIAAKLGISLNTARNHQLNIRSKLDVRNRTQIALYVLGVAPEVLL